MTVNVAYISLIPLVQLGGIFTYAIGQMQGFPVYKAIFLICGFLTLIWGGVLMWLLPDNPMTAKRFTLEEKAALLGVGRRNQTVSCWMGWH